MQQIVNEVYRPVFIREGRFRYIILMGGRGAGRSTVASQYALAHLAAPEYFRCAIMRYILGDIRNSIYREMIDRAEENGVVDALDINEGSMSIKYGQNLINAMGFKKSSGDQKAKLKSLANYNCVIIEEADEVSEEDFMQLDDSLRTMKGDITIFLLLNPPVKTHWIIRRWFNLELGEATGFYKPVLKPEMTDTLFIHTRYTDNIKNIAPHSVENYERYRFTKPAHYYNMIRGLVPEIVRGKIYTNWKEIPEVPHEARLEAYVLDFGYHPDPATITAVYYLNGGYILDEITYQRELKNRQLATILLNQPEKAMTIADNAEPKSIAEMKEYGVDIIPCVKGADSVRHGIKKVQAEKISYTKRSTNIKREYDAFKWKIDKDGNELEIVDPSCEDHIMDPVRYFFLMQKPENEEDVRERRREVNENRRETVNNAQRDAGL